MGHRKPSDYNRRIAVSDKGMNCSTTAPNIPYIYLFLVKTHGHQLDALVPSTDLCFSVGSGNQAVFIGQVHGMLRALPSSNTILITHRPCIPILCFVYCISYCTSSKAYITALVRLCFCNKTIKSHHRYHCRVKATKVLVVFVILSSPFSFFSLLTPV